VARLLSDIDEQGLGNIRLFRDDARLLLSALRTASIDRAFILFPDPWPKTRHHKRRIVSPETVPQLARILADGAELRIATDDPGYKSWILRHVRASDAFEWTAREPQDWRCRPTDWPGTRYEEKAQAAGRTPSFFRFRRRSRQAV
jgi:tRNA (guanine-N7-)-methyltransferase